MYTSKKKPFLGNIFQPRFRINFMFCLKVFVYGNDLVILYCYAFLDPSPNIVFEIIWIDLQVVKIFVPNPVVDYNKAHFRICLIVSLHCKKVNKAILRTQSEDRLNVFFQFFYGYWEASDGL